MLGLFEVSKVLVICDDHHWIFHSCEVVSPFLECLDDCQEFSVIDVIVPFSRGKGGRIVSTGVKVSVGVLLHEYSSSGSEGGIGHDIEQFRSVQHFDYQGREEYFFELDKCVVLFLSP